MKKSFYLLLLITLYSSISFAQSLKSISILGVRIQHLKDTCNPIPIAFGIMFLRGSKRM